MLKEHIYELTNPQKNILNIEKFYSKTSINNICGTAIINEVVDIDALKQSILMLIQKHNNFRLKFFNDNGVVRQYLSDSLPNNIDVIEVDSISDIDRYRKQIVSKPFELNNNFLFNFYIFKLPNKHAAFVLNIHHLLADAWTLGFVSNEIIKTYSSIINNSHNEIDNTYSYIDYINSEQDYLKSEKFKKDQLFWETQFNTVPELASIPGSIDNISNLNSSEAKRLNFCISDYNVKIIRNFCRENNVSLYNFFMSIFGIYIGRVCGLNSFVIGSPILNRTNFKEKNCFGMFISTMPFKIELQNELSFLDFIKHTSRSSLNMLKHQKYPYQSIIENLHDESNNISNLYNILLSYQITNAKNNESNINYTTEWTFNGNCADSLDIHLYDLNDTGELNMSYDYKTGLYSEKDISSIHERILYIIHQVIHDSSILLKNIDIVTTKERELLLNEFNNNKYDYNYNKSVISLFEEQVKSTPLHTALISNEISFSYNELNEKSNILANHLISNGISHDDIVAIMLNRSPEMIIGLLAILKCGATYLPIDPEYPEDRIKYMLKNSNTKNVLINKLTEEKVPVGYNKIDISLQNTLYNDYSSENLNIDISTKTLMYLIYTSGSTGKPKGVMVTHRNVLNFVLGMKKIIQFSPDKVLVSLTTICFDIFGLELFCSLTSGLTLVLANENEQNSPSLLNTLCLNNNVNMIQTTPSRYTAILEDPNYLEFFDNITDILVGGEALSKKVFSQLKNIASNAKIYNMYGPTETTIWSTVKDLTHSDYISIGKPIINTNCYILDKNCNNLLPPYTPGELYIGGDGVSKGYLKRKELTNEKFILSPFDKNELIYNTNDLAYFTDTGEIMHLGRTDFQVKIRGYRVELGEIENRIIKFPGITNSVVVSSTDNKYLVCYYTSDIEIKNSKLISYLLRYLPNYMIPAYFVKLDYIPLTPNGKIDRKSLPTTYSSNNSSIELPKTATEKLISKLLSDILDTDKLDVNTPFLSLGLDSLGIIKLQTSLLVYNLNLTTQDFYRYPSIKKLARRIDKHIDYYTELNSQIPDQFKHKKEDLKDSLLDEVDILGNVLLTGANGFIGIHVLYELLTTTNSTIYCFVRGDDISHSIARLEESFNFYFNKDLKQYLNTRVKVYNGQIIYNKFKLSDSELEEISNNINTIIHTAAIVKHYGDFEQFKTSNIDGTKRIVKFAHKFKKRLIHISSISVSGNYLVKQDNKNVSFSENDLYIGQHYTNNVYVNSKFDAEKIVYSYMEKGLTAEVLRIGILSGRYSDGYFQKNISENAFYGRIKSLVDLGIVQSDMLEQKIEFTPVDLCARAIVLLSKYKCTENKVYHLFNHNLYTIKSILDMLSTFGFNIKTVSSDEFKKKIIAISENPKLSNSLKGIINDLTFTDSSVTLDYGFTVNITSDYTINYLRKLGFKWPEVNTCYLKSLINYMINVNFL